MERPGAGAIASVFLPLGGPCGQGHTGCSQTIILQIVLVREILFLKVVPLLVTSGGTKKHLKGFRKKTEMNKLSSLCATMRK